VVDEVTTLVCEEMTADGMYDMSKRDQLFTRSLYGSTLEGHETYFSEPMIPTIPTIKLMTLRLGLGTVLQSVAFVLRITPSEKWT